MVSEGGGRGAGGAALTMSVASRFNPSSTRRLSVARSPCSAALKRALTLSPCIGRCAVIPPRIRKGCKNKGFIYYASNWFLVNVLNTKASECRVR